MDLSPIYKAVAGGIVGLVTALLARYGFQPSAPTVTALGVIVTALLGYFGGHLLVFLAPANKSKGPTV